MAVVLSNATQTAIHYAWARSFLKEPEAAWMSTEKVSKKTHAIVTQQRAEVLGFLLVHELDKTGAVDGVDG